VWAEKLPDNRRLSIAFPSKQADSVMLLPRGSQQLEGADESNRAPMRAPEKVMVIHATSRLTKALSSQLESEGYEVFHYDSTEDAIRDVNLTRLDLIVLEGKLADGDSVNVCKQLRRHTEVPVAIVATSATEEQRVKALKAGADDYITEPISKEELLEKINVLFKRQQLADRAQQPLDFGDMRIDFARRKVFINHLPVVLTRIEYDLLRTLAVNAGQVLTHQQLLEKVWGPEYSSETQYLWVNISRLRKKLEPTSYIQNQQGIGYIFQKT
jgi:two-component system KDP operon response regulator KdpE